MTQEFKIGDKVRYKVGEEEACKSNNHEFGEVYTIKSIFEFGESGHAYAQFEKVNGVARTFRLEHVESDHDATPLMTRKQLIEKLQEVATQRYENYRDNLYDLWNMVDSVRSYDEWLTKSEKENLERYEQEMLQFNQLQ